MRRVNETRRPSRCNAPMRLALALSSSLGDSCSPYTILLHARTGATPAETPRDAPYPHPSISSSLPRTTISNASPLDRLQGRAARGWRAQQASALSSGEIVRRGRLAGSHADPALQVVLALASVITTSEGLSLLLRCLLDRDLTIDRNDPACRRVRTIKLDLLALHRRSFLRLTPLSFDLSRSTRTSKDLPGRWQDGASPPDEYCRTMQPTEGLESFCASFPRRSHLTLAWPNDSRSTFTSALTHAQLIQRQADSLARSPTSGTRTRFSPCVDYSLCAPLQTAPGL